MVVALPVRLRKKCTIFETVDSYRMWRSRSLPLTATIGLVVTKGTIHRGHLALAREARRYCTHVAISIFIDEMQFGSAEECRKFPRDRKSDIEKVVSSGDVDILLFPRDPNEIFRHGARGATISFQSDLVPRAYCNVEQLSGECTVVVKMINIVQPALLLMGQRDIIICRVVERLIDDLMLPCKTLSIPTVREEGPVFNALTDRTKLSSVSHRSIDSDQTSKEQSGYMMDPIGSPDTTPRVSENVPGVAFNSRLELLSNEERVAVGAVYKALTVMIKAYLDDEFSSNELILRGTLTLQVEPLLRINHVRIAHPFGLQDIDQVDPVIGAIAAISVNVNGVVNITDNIIMAPHIPRPQRSFWGLVKTVSRSPSSGRKRRN